MLGEIIPPVTSYTLLHQTYTPSAVLVITFPQTSWRELKYASLGSISVSGQLRTYPSPNPTVTLTY